MKKPSKSTRIMFRRNLKTGEKVAVPERLKLHKINNYLSVTKQIHLSWLDVLYVGSSTSKAICLHTIATATFIKNKGIPEKPFQMLCALNMIVVLSGCYFVSQEDILKFLPWNRRTVSACLKWGIDHGMIIIVKGGLRGFPGLEKNRPNKYYLDANGQSILNEYYDLCLGYYKQFKVDGDGKIQFNHHESSRLFTKHFS